MNNWTKDDSEIDLTKHGDITHILTRNVIIDECVRQFQKEVDDWNSVNTNQIPCKFVSDIKSRFEYFKDNFEKIIKGEKND